MGEIVPQDDLIGVVLTVVLLLGLAMVVSDWVQLSLRMVVYSRDVQSSLAMVVVSQWVKLCFG